MKCCLNENVLKVYIWTNLIVDVIKNAAGICAAIICDGNRVNQEFCKMLNTKGSRRTTYNMFSFVWFCLFDKKVRSKWISQSFQELDFQANREKKTAKWADIKALCSFEANQIVKISKLTEVSPYSEPFKRQRVSHLVFKFFLQWSTYQHEKYSLIYKTMMET